MQFIERQGKNNFDGDELKLVGDHHHHDGRSMTMMVLTTTMVDTTVCASMKVATTATPTREQIERYPSERVRKSW